MRVLLTAAALIATIATSAGIAAERIGGPRLRPQDTRIVNVVREGSMRSATFRALVDRIEASNVIVYVALNPLLKSSLSGSLTWMTRTGEFRYLRASISTDLTFDQMIATVAHELQHAVEVIEDQSVQDERSLVALYQRIGEPSRAANSGWETASAQQTGYKVRRELIEMPAGAVMARANSSTRS